jgi:hypothetical protein
MKRAAVILLILTLFTSFELHAQSKLEQDLVGLWKAVRVHDMGDVIPNLTKQQIEIMQTRLIGSRFHFKADHNFSFESSFKKMNLKDVHWKILPD